MVKGVFFSFSYVDTLLERKQYEKNEDLFNCIESSSAGFKIRIHRFRVSTLDKDVLAKKVKSAFKAKLSLKKGGSVVAVLFFFEMEKFASGFSIAVTVLSTYTMAIV